MKCTQYKETTGTAFGWFHGWFVQLSLYGYEFWNIPPGQVHQKVEVNRVILGLSDLVYKWDSCGFVLIWNFLPGTEFWQWCLVATWGWLPASWTLSNQASIFFRAGFVFFHFVTDWGCKTLTTKHAQFWICPPPLPSRVVGSPEAESEHTHPGQTLEREAHPFPPVLIIVILFKFWYWHRSW